MSISTFCPLESIFAVTLPLSFLQWIKPIYLKAINVRLYPNYLCKAIQHGIIQIIFVKQLNLCKAIQHGVIPIILVKLYPNYLCKAIQHGHSVFPRMITWRNVWILKKWALVWMEYIANLEKSKEGFFKVLNCEKLRKVQLRLVIYCHPSTAEREYRCVFLNLYLYYVKYVFLDRILWNFWIVRNCGRCNLVGDILPS